MRWRGGDCDGDERRVGSAIAVRAWRKRMVFNGGFKDGSWLEMGC